MSPAAHVGARPRMGAWSGACVILTGLVAAVPVGVAAQDTTLVAPQSGQPPADQAQPQAQPPQQLPPSQLPSGFDRPPQGAQIQQPQRARRGEDCDPVGYRVLSSVVQFGGARTTYMGLPEFVCADGIRVRADSAVDYEASGRIEFIGGFRYEDADRILTAVNADYFEAQGLLLARGDVTVLARDETSEVRGDTLRLFEGVAGPADDQLVVTGNPAFALFYPETNTPEADGPETDTGDSDAGVVDPGDAAAVDDPAQPYELTGVVLRFEGEDFVYADGNAVLVRDSLRGNADRLTFARESGVLTLTDNARLDSDGSEFQGDAIELLVPGDELTAINVRGQGRLRTEDLTLDAAEIRIDMEDGEMRHLVAVRRAGGTPAPAPVPPPPGPDGPVPSGPGGEPARAESDAFVLVGDSIDVVSEDGVLRTAWAVGAARAVARGAEEADADVPQGPDSDSADAPADQPTAGPPNADTTSGDDPIAADDPVRAPAVEAVDEEQDALALLLAEDWIEGDTIEVVFAPAPEPRAEDDPGYVLDGLIATGNARSLYRSPPDDVDAEGRPVARPPRDRWAISYMLADRISLALADGTVDNVESTGNVVGEYLEPVRPGAAAADSTQTSGDQ